MCSRMCSRSFIIFCLNNRRDVVCFEDVYFLAIFWTLKESGPLLSIDVKRALMFHLKYLNLCSKYEHGSQGFGMTGGRVINNNSHF